MVDRVSDILLLEVPVALWARSADHLAAQLGDLRLVADAKEAGTVPHRVVVLADCLAARYADVLAAPEAELRSARVRGIPVVDVVYTVPPSAGADAAEAGRLLDEVDEYCRAGDLRALVTPPDCVAYRRWFLGEVVRQLAGGFPEAWSAKPR